MSTDPLGAKRSPKPVFYRIQQLDVLAVYPLADLFKL